MPSHLRLQSSFEPVDAQATHQPTSPTLPPKKKARMSLTQTYYIASTARSKLGREASRADHDLRILVGHANMLDTLMVELADAEREQESWFNESVRAASKPQEQHITWIDTIEEEDESSDDESDDGSVYDEDAEEFYVPLRKIRSPPVEFSSQEIDSDYDSDEDMYDEEEDLAPLERVASRHSPPELIHEDSDSEDESLPPSPENTVLDYTEKERQAMTTTTFYDEKMEAFLPQQPQAPLIAAC